MPVHEKIWTVLDIIKWGTEYLTEKGFDEARLNIELLLAATLEVKRFDLYVKHDQPLKKSELERFKILLKRRLAHEPIQYILGKTNFYSIELKTDSRALIPRPETEILAEAVIEHCRTLLSQKDEIAVMDVGTGTGCIAIAVAKFVKNAVVTAIDVDPLALELASENVKSAAVAERVKLVQADILKTTGNAFGCRFDIIVSNPPYVPQPDLSGLPEEIKRYEPTDALTDGLDGLAFYRKLSQLARSLLKSGGWICVETQFGQARMVEDIFHNAGGKETEIKRDLSNIDRIVKARFFADDAQDGSD